MEDIAHIPLVHSAFHEVADLVVEEGHVVVGEGVDDHLADAPRIGVGYGQGGDLRAGYHRSVLCLHDEVTGFRGAVEVVDRNTKHPRQDRLVEDARVLVAREYESEFGEPNLPAFAVQREHDRVDGIGVEKNGIPLQGFPYHAVEFLLA